MKRNSFLLASLLWVGLSDRPSLAIVPAGQWGTATAQDIVNALGPDSDGLALDAELLPDLFDLTASRIEEDARKFFVEEKYRAGRWKGGKVVIEYARDLSYTIVSVYDKKGKRQRIYSVRAAPKDEKTIEANRVRFQQIVKSPEAVPVTAEVPDLTREEMPAEPVVRPAAPAPAPLPAATKKSHSRNRRTAPAEKPEPAPAPAVVSAEPAPKSSSVWVPAAPVKKESDAVASATAEPGSAYVWDEQQGAYVPVKSGAQAAAPATESVPAARKPSAAETTAVVAEKPKSRRSRHASKNESSVPAVAQVPVSAAMPSAAAAASPTIARGGAPSKPGAEAVPSTEELIAGADSIAESPPPKPKPVLPPVSTVTPSEKAAVEEARRAKELEAEQKRIEELAKREAAKRPAAPAAAQEPAPVDEAQVPLDSDQWKPKNAKPAPAVDPAMPRVAMIPKTPPSRQAQLDNMIHAAQDGKPVTAEGDAWTPKKTALPKTDVQTQAEIAQVRAQQKKAPAPVVKLHSDVNNPEEGVMPVNEFEKFSGPRYGRHREYERRFYYGSRAKAPVKDYDFYIDEVDRKKEIHNIYYYKKGKAPKLIAVERHSDVTFLSNYDVDKEDKGKVTTY